MSEAAAKPGANNHRIRRLIKDGLLLAEQVVPRAPYQIQASDLLDQKVIDAAARTERPCRAAGVNQIPMCRRHVSDGRTQALGVVETLTQAPRQTMGCLPQLGAAL